MPKGSLAAPACGGQSRRSGGPTREWAARLESEVWQVFRQGTSGAVWAPVGFLAPAPETQAAPPASQPRRGGGDLWGTRRLCGARWAAGPGGLRLSGLPEP